MVAMLSRRKLSFVLLCCSYVQTGVYGGQGGAGMNKVVVSGAGAGGMGAVGAVGAPPTPPLLPPPAQPLPQPPPLPLPQPGLGLGPGANDAPLGRNDPYFDSMTPRNVTALVGKSAYLSCRVRNLGNRTVSWIRHRDIHILTVGGYTYTSDQRFQANHHRDNEDWTLQIKWAQKRDAGVYECQISTQPVRSYFVNLNIVDTPPPDEELTSEAPQPPPRRLSDDAATAAAAAAAAAAAYEARLREAWQRRTHNTYASVPTAQILGGPDLHVDRGSTINLTCIIKYSPEPPAYIFWYHHDEELNSPREALVALVELRTTFNIFSQVISYDSSRGGVSVITEKGEVTTSYLLIQHAELADSGKYSCSPSNADVASVRVHVLNGERPAAMQTGSAGLSNSSLNVVMLIFLCLLYSALLESAQLQHVTLSAAAARQRSRAR